MGFCSFLIRYLKPVLQNLERKHQSTIYINLMLIFNIHLSFGESSRECANKHTLAENTLVHMWLGYACDCTSSTHSGPKHSKIWDVLVPLMLTNVAQQVDLLILRRTHLWVCVCVSPHASVASSARPAKANIWKKGPCVWLHARK